MQSFEQTRVYARVFGLADKLTGKPAPRAVLPQIPLHSPKITRNLTTDWFANRVEAPLPDLPAAPSRLTLTEREDGRAGWQIGYQVLRTGLEAVLLISITLPQILRGAMKRVLIAKIGK